jgi:predicted alpha/beta-fold hydrolase
MADLLHSASRGAGAYAPPGRSTPRVPPPSFRPGWWIPGSHAQTVYGKLVRRPPHAPVRTERWDTADGDFLDVARLDPSGPYAGRRDAPRLLLLHGLEGGMQSHYVHGLFAACAGRGWGMDLMLHRSCGPEMNRARRLYHSGETGDAALFVERVAAEHPDAPLTLCGVSLGGNQLVKYLGERGAAGPAGHTAGDVPAGSTTVPPGVRGAVAISVPYDLARGSRHIGRGFSRVYERHFLRSLVRKAELKLLAYPDIVDRARLTELRTLWDFDDVLTGPLHGFQDAADYYGRSSAIRFVAGVRVPTLLLSAADDPFLPPAVLDDVRREAAANPWLTVEFHAHGGHVGFVGGRVPWRPDYYAERRTVEWAAAHVGEGAPGPTAPAPTIPAPTIPAPTIPVQTTPADLA